MSYYLGLRIARPYSGWTQGSFQELDLGTVGLQDALTVAHLSKASTEDPYLEVHGTSYLRLTIRHAHSPLCPHRPQSRSPLQVTPTIRSPEGLRAQCLRFLVPKAIHFSGSWNQKPEIWGTGTLWVGFVARSEKSGSPTNLPVPVFQTPPKFGRKVP